MTRTGALPEILSVLAKNLRHSAPVTIVESKDRIRFRRGTSACPNSSGSASTWAILRLRTGGTACTLGGTVKAPSTLGTSCAASGGATKLDRVSRDWPGLGRPGRDPATGPSIDLDSTICETYGPIPSVVLRNRGIWGGLTGGFRRPSVR